MAGVWPLDPDSTAHGIRDVPTSGLNVSSDPAGSRGIWSRLCHDAHHWLAFIGPGRLVLGVLSGVGLVVGGWLLVREPPPPTESLMPRATALPVPVSTAPTMVVVHVAGAVARPGVYTLPSGSRAVDAVSAAGGATRGADLAALNLALVLVDTEQVYVPLLGREGSRALVSPRLRPAPVAGASGANAAAPASKVNLNTASATDLDALPGIGPSLAAAIVTHRTDKGPFVSVDGLLDVPGIGEAKLSALRDLVTV